MEHNQPQSNQAAPQPPKRRRNAAATRQAILDAARLAFTRAGYDGVGVREIAHDAGVTAMLVNRYFGSKEKLFEEVVAVTLSGPGVLRSEILGSSAAPQALCRAVAEALMAKSSPGLVPDGILILLRSAANPQAARILRENAIGYLRPLIDLIPGANPAERASMMLSVIAGFQLMRQIIGLPGLTGASPDILTDQLAALFLSLVVPQDRDASAGTD